MVDEGKHAAVESPEPAPKFAFGKKVYDGLKFLALVLLPAGGAFYFSLAGVWNLPNAEQVVGTVVTVDTFLGVILGISTRNYNNSDTRFAGDLNVAQTAEDGTYMSLGLNVPASVIAGKDSVLLKVVKQ